MEDVLDLVYGSLANPARRTILQRLAHGECTVAELRRPLEMSAPAVSRHLRVLSDAGLIECRRQGRNQICRLRVGPLSEAEAWCREQRLFWLQTLDSLESHLRQGEA